MSRNSLTLAAARAFAQSALELAEEQGQADALAEELRALASAVVEPGAVAFFENPSIPASEQARVAAAAVAGGSSLLRNLVGVLAEKRRLAALPMVADAYDDRLRHLRGKVNVTLTVAQALDESQLAKVGQSVTAALGKQALLRQTVDPGIIGGLVLQVEDTLIDGSVKCQLDQLRRRLLEAGQNA